MGAINKFTKHYCCAKLADKKEKYICPECNKDLIIRKGTKRIHHFAHYKKDNPCNYYNNPNETQIHKDAKLALKQILETGINLKIIRKCCSCECNIYNWDIPNLKNYNIVIEHRFDFNNSLKIADLAVLSKNNIYTLFEIYNSHISLNDDRPEPWFEFDAKNILNNINIENFEFVCIRKKKCKGCLEKYNINNLVDWLNLYGKKWNGDREILENLVRKVLGQTDFKVCNTCNNERFVKGDKYEYGDGNYSIKCKDCDRPDHLRFDFDAQENFQENKKIIDIFNSFLSEYYIIIHSHKGGITTYIINKEDERKYNYYNCDECYVMDCKHPYKCIIDHYCGDGTIDIIIRMLKAVYYYLPSFNKMTKLDYWHISKKIDDDMIDISIYRYIKKEKLYYKYYILKKIM